MFEGKEKQKFKMACCLFSCQEQACHEGGEGSDGYQAEAAYHGIQDFGGHIFIVQDVIDGGSLGHEDHEEGNIAAGIGEKKGSRHGAHGCAAHAQAWTELLPRAGYSAFGNDLVYGRGNVNSQVHHGAGSADKNTRHKNRGRSRSW